jgi:hypothetical protein
MILANRDHQQRVTEQEMMSYPLKQYEEKNFTDKKSDQEGFL